MYDEYGRVLLTATTFDGFNHLISIAFVIIEGKKSVSWSWFMDRLKKKVILQRRDVCVISNRHDSIISAINSTNL